MKRSYLLIALFGISNVLHAADSQAQTEVSQAINAIIAAYNGAEQSLANDQNRPSHLIDAEQKQQLKNQAVQAIAGLEQLGQQLQEKDLSSAANTLDTLQNQFGLRQADIPRFGDYLRRADKLYQQWQQQTGATLQTATPTQMGQLLTLTANALANGSQAEREIGGIVRIISGYLTAFSQLEDNVNHYDLEAAKLSRDVARLKNLAAAQGINTAQSDRVQALMDALKQRAGEQSIGESNPKADEKIIASLSQLLSHPVPLFSAQQADTIERLLAQLGNNYRGIYTQWQQQRQQLIFDNPSQDSQSIARAIEQSQLPAEKKRALLNALRQP